MTHADAGHYAAKHAGAELNKKIAVKVGEKTSGGGISCGAVHAIVNELKVTPLEVGVTLGLLEVCIEKCQLGLFGHGEKKRIVKPADEVAPKLQKDIEAILVNGRLPCKESWEIAEKFKMKRLDLANACENLNIKINSCQIGSF